MDLESSVPTTPPPQNRSTYKTIGIIGLILIILCVITYIFIAATFSRSDQIAVPTPIPSLAPQVTDWKDRILYIALTEQNQLSGQLHSVNENGSVNKVHPLICDGERITPIGDIARSPDGKTVAFVLPLPEERKKDPQWVQSVLNGTGKFTNGIIYLYSLSTDTCTSTSLSADNMYSQNLTFSPNGKYLAYVFYGLHVYDLAAKKDAVVTQQEGSASIPAFILGPLQWNKKSTAVYMPVATNISGNSSPVNLLKVDFPTGESNPIFQLPSYFTEKTPNVQAFVIAQPTAPQPDNPSVYAISPDEEKIIYEFNTNLVIQDIVPQNNPVKTIFNSAQAAGTAQKVSWLPSGWIVYNYRYTSVGSSIGSEMASYNGDEAIALPGYAYSANLNGDKMVYNFEYFGKYYIDPSSPTPIGWDPTTDGTGHRYDGIGIYDFSTKKSIVLSGDQKPTGRIWTWYW